MYTIDFSNPVHVYFVGIGGISMSGLAQILKSRGFTVSGSDREASAITDELSKDGITVHIGQSAQNITPDIDLAVFTAAIHPDNPEYVRIHELGIPCLNRAQLLGQLMRGYRSPVAVSGTHGKTTTTSMLSDILLAADTDPTLSIGGVLESVHSNVRVGGESYFDAEACEYTNSFLEMFPKTAIILNIDADHLDFFKDLDDIRRSFRLFAERVPADGTLIISCDIPDYEQITEGLPCRVITFGEGPLAMYTADDIDYDASGCPAFTLRVRDDADIPVRGLEDPAAGTRIRLRVPGIHNVWNAVAASAAADLLGISREDTKRALENFGGAQRRFEKIGTCRGFTLIDDYAHHPTEIRASLRAAQATAHREIYCVFQSHTYTRTKALLHEFAKALTLADHIVLADIYAARETDDLGISAQTLADEIRALGHPCEYFPSFEEIEDYLLKNCQSDDLVITMGAGNVNKIAYHLVSSDR